MKFSTLISALSAASLATATLPLPITPHRLLPHITTTSLLSTLKSLDRIATANNGNRAFGLSGYKASVDHIVSQLKWLPGLKYEVQPFTALFAQVDSITLKDLSTDEELYVFGLTYSPSTSEEGLTLPLALGPDGIDGCSAEGYGDRDVKGKIVLVQRFRCPDTTTLAGRVRAAVAAGAEAVIVYNDVTTKPTAGSLSAPDPVALRPAGYITIDDGEKLKARLEAGEEIEMFFQHTQTIEDRETWNIIAETKKGDADAVIAVGAHLDSVQAGAGINDDGSGTALILELARAASWYTPNLKLRFCWWGAEENGLLGSEHYVNTLPAEELAKIRAYMNFDMVSRGYYGVFDGDGDVHGLAGAPGSGKIEELYRNYLTKYEKVEVTPAVFTGGSDYASFMEKGIPVGGLHTGTGVAQDPCYHQECDTFQNANSTILTKNTRAAAYVLGTLAQKGKELIPQWTEGETMSIMGKKEIEWSVEEGAKHTGCGHDEL